MKKVRGIIIAGAVCVSSAVLCFAEGPPGWAYGFPPGPAAPAVPAAAPAAAPAPDTTPRHLPGNNLEFTRAQISNGFGPADWYPEDHPQMPDVVAHGQRPEVRACSLCHYPNGEERAANAGVSGLSTAYFIQQKMNFRNGDRRSAAPRKGNTNAMIAIAKGM